MPDIAGKVGPGDDGLETPRRTRSSTHGRARREPDPSLWYNLERPPYFRWGELPAREGTPEPPKGMVVVRGQEGMLIRRYVSVEASPKQTRMNLEGSEVRSRNLHVRSQGRQT